MINKRVILLTGLSGAGKTSTLGILEDMGYHCIDHFPSQLLSELGLLILKASDPRYENVAISITLLDFDAFYNYLRNLDIDLRVLVLECSHEELLRRYKFSRRNHPLLILNKVNTLEEAISYEIDVLKSFKDTPFLNIDTTFLKSTELKAKINKYFALNTQPSFTISFISFGYKNGIPMDADLLFDIRFLPNPFWIEELKNLNGNDQAVEDYVMKQADTLKFIKKLETFLDYSLKEYTKEGKNHFTIGIGCTGGKHRSVVLVNNLYTRYSKKYKCFKEHRDLD